MPLDRFGDVNGLEQEVAHGHEAKVIAKGPRCLDGPRS